MRHPLQLTPCLCTLTCAYFMSWLSKPSSSSKVHLNVLLLSSLYFLSFFIFCQDFSFLAFLLLSICHVSWGLFFLFLLLELASTMAESSFYCWYFDRISVYWLVFDINLHQLLGIDEVRGDVMVGHQCHRCGSWRSLNMHMTNGIVQTAHFFCLVVCVF